MTPKDKLAGLLQRYLEGTATDAERQAVEDWFEKSGSKTDAEEMLAEQHEELYNTILGQLAEEGEFVKTDSRKTYPHYWVAAASILIFLAFSGIFWLQYVNKHKEPQVKENLVKNDLQPGGNKATLTLADGSVIKLGDSEKGMLAQQGAIKIVKTKEGQVQYDGRGRADAEEITNILRTPLGGKYQLILPDGTHVWLNAGSSLQFPVSFSGSERRVTLKGEAYFEVAKNRTKPFKVIVNSMIVQVLGTHFNVMAYENEPVIKTTLLEGSVKVSTTNSAGLLVPGQQASITHLNGNLKISETDTEREIAWKNDLFWFDNADIQTVMKQIARWYNVEVKFEGTIPKTFSGTIPRTMTAVKVLEILEQTGGAHFRIEGNTITCYK